MLGFLLEKSSLFFSDSCFYSSVNQILSLLDFISQTLFDKSCFILCFLQRKIA